MVLGLLSRDNMRLTMTLESTIFGSNKDSRLPFHFFFFNKKSIAKMVPLTARRSSQSILKEISLEYPLGGLMLKLKLQYFGHLR